MSDHFIGLISGTSMDAIDAVLVDLSSAHFKLVATHHSVLDSQVRAELLELISASTPGDLRQLARLDVQLGHLFADAAIAVLAAAGMAADRIRAIGSHGQTVWHEPFGKHPCTLQIGDPNTIAARTGITTVGDFRRRDIAEGGQAAPLVPAFHAALFRSPDEDRVVLNIGGMANITILPAADDNVVRGFDTGPGNVLLDLWIARELGENFDRDGRWSAGGTVDTDLLEALRADPYFAAPPPKSTGREHFNMEWLERALTCVAPLSAQQVQATLSELTALTIADAIVAHAPATQRILVCGGGAFNADLMQRLRERLTGRTVESTQAHGLDPRWVEASAFAWLASRTLAGAAGNLPSVTGARCEAVLGAIYPGRPGTGKWQ